MENKAKNSFISFLFGLMIGWWPFRWVSTILVFLSGFFLGSSYSLADKLLKLTVDPNIMQCIKNVAEK